jgi:hypothetical protein
VPNDQGVWTPERTRRAWGLGLAAAVGFATPFVREGWFETWDLVGFAAFVLAVLSMPKQRRRS